MVRSPPQSSNPRLKADAHLKLVDNNHLSNLARFTTKAYYHRYGSRKPDWRQKYYWVYRCTASVFHLGQVTILLSNRWHNDGPKEIKLIVTNLAEATTGTILSYYHSRWGVEVAFKEPEKRGTSGVRCR